MDVAKLYETQISLTEWFEKLGHARTSELRVEDNEKRERLKVLKDRIGLPFDAPVKFPASDLAGRTQALEAYLAAHGDELCALRLIPSEPDVPKLRMRGKSVREVMGWFDEQRIDAAKYRAEFVPHAQTSTWSTIFVVTPSGVLGEIVRGGHHQLTQGVYEGEPPVTFAFDFERWTFSRDDATAAREAQAIVERLHVSDEHVREALASELGAVFVRNYLLGYFETATSDAFGLWFIDYNRLLADELGTIRHPVAATDAPAIGAVLLRGQCGSPGSASGRVRIVALNDIAETALDADEILVCPMTTPDYLSLMRQAAAVVTDLGGILSHAAIVCRELGKPCVTATGVATQTLADGQAVIVDADRGIVRAA